MLASAAALIGDQMTYLFPPDVKGGHLRVTRFELETGHLLPRATGDLCLFVAAFVRTWVAQTHPVPCRLLQAGPPARGDPAAWLRRSLLVSPAWFWHHCRTVTSEATPDEPDRQSAAVYWLLLASAAALIGDQMTYLFPVDVKGGHLRITRFDLEIGDLLFLLKHGFGSRLGEILLLAWRLLEMALLYGAPLLIWLGRRSRPITFIAFGIGGLALARSIGRWTLDPAPIGPGWVLWIVACLALLTGLFLGRSRGSESQSCALG
ncbi:hypothetical protein [Luteolibacter sp. LG18]|uniref:hypothetical protein n=1 Tax=Luteolibacter sp. LG18 TaxID=2819286 RepID=UPI002B28A543|nr:hypothetical protein llg_26910 [Luteolibacter sp. LG18]